MTGGVRLILLLGVAALLAACGSSKVVRDGASRPAARVSTPKYGATTTVRKGDTLYRIAVNNGISPLDLAMWNDVPPPYVIHPGQRLRLYPGGVATRPGHRRRAATHAAGVLRRDRQRRFRRQRRCRRRNPWSVTLPGVGRPKAN